jgi:chemotaxis protein methyltransferase CheR
MPRAPDHSERFRGWISQRFGLNFDDTKLDFLADVLGRRADKRGLAPRPYLDRLDGPDVDSEMQALAVELTVPETYFFRHIDQFHAFAGVALPHAQAARAAQRTLTVLSAGCASGEEPYTLAMLLRERVTEPGWKIVIRALDINPAMLAKAARGCYSAWALRETPADPLRRWFRSVGREFQLDDSIVSAVSFQETNLSRESAELWEPATYDVIFCRNVMMYFTADVARALVSRLTRSLVPGGHLFLGHAETLRGLSNDYHLCHTHDTFYYQRKDALAADEPAASALGGDARDGSPAGSAALVAAAAADSGGYTNWLQTVQHASDRIRALTQPSSPKAGPSAAPILGDTARASQILLALDLLKEERFTDALDRLTTLSPESASDPEVLLLRAVLLVHSGQLTAAERVSNQLLENDELNTGAHYLLALCRESAGDIQGSVDHDRAAVYLDPGFAMPRLHLGLMARRGGDMEGAQRELSQALLLLEREDSSRLLLFGGGFGRGALISLCRAELLATGGLP